MTIPFADIDAILFDLDGTLANTDDEVVASLSKRLKPLFGRRALALARRLVMAVETPGNAFITLLDAFHLDSHMIRLKERRQEGQPPPDFPLIPGAADMLDRLAGRYPLALVTTRSRRHIDHFLEQHPTIAAALTTTCGMQDTRRLKPHPEPVVTAAQRLNVPVARCLMVGDTTMDVLAGRRAGAWTVGVLCGFGHRKELHRAGAHLILDNTTDLEQLTDAI